jgi:tetratricopeptide (TPR) repeat protein
MIRSNRLPVTGLLFRPVLGAVAALGLVGGVTANPAEAQAQGRGQAQAQAPKITLSKSFQPLAVGLNKAINDAKARPDVVAARANATTAQTALQQARGAARTQAQANLDAAVAALGTTLSAEKSQLDAAFTAATSADDRYMAGSLAIGLGDLARDTRIQRRGLEAMLGSGKVAPAEAPRLQYFLGQFAFDQKDYAAARTALQAAIAGGFTDNDIDGLLAEAYISDGQVSQGLTVLKQAIDRRNATPNKAPVGWYRRGLGAAYNAKLLDRSVEFSMALVQAYPTTENWAGAIQVVREIGKFAPQETLDLMRLMGRTNSYAEERDYIEYIQAADARRLPGEVLKVIEQGTTAGKLRGTDQFVAEARTIASGRVAADRASLASLERDARAPTATVATISGAADAFLSYGESAKAEALYTLALTKPGADTARLYTRLGIAQLDQGNFAGARETFAQLWSLLASQRATPPA